VHTSDRQAKLPIRVQNEQNVLNDVFKYTLASYQQRGRVFPAAQSSSCYHCDY
jgi:hypothetical protein